MKSKKNESIRSQIIRWHYAQLFFSFRSDSLHWFIIWELYLLMVRFRCPKFGSVRSILHWPYRIIYGVYYIISIWYGRYIIYSELGNKRSQRNNERLSNYIATGGIVTGLIIYLTLYILIKNRPENLDGLENDWLQCFVNISNFI